METESGHLTPGHANQIVDPSTETTTSELDGMESSPTSIDEVDSLLDDVERALSRLDDGSYGTCDSCGSPIHDAELAETPTRHLCAACEPANAA